MAVCVPQRYACMPGAWGGEGRTNPQVAQSLALQCARAHNSAREGVLHAMACQHPTGACVEAWCPLDNLLLLPQQEMPGGEQDMLAFLEWLSVRHPPGDGPDRVYLLDFLAEWMEVRVGMLPGTSSPA